MMSLQKSSMRTFMAENSRSIQTTNPFPSYSMLKNASQTWHHRESKGGHSLLRDIGMTFATKLEQVWEMLMP